jgi:hypothetical protein
MSGDFLTSATRMEEVSIKNLLLLLFRTIQSHFDDGNQKTRVGETILST